MTADKVKEFLEVGTNDKGEVVINHPDLKPDDNGIGHIVFSPRQARELGELLLKKAHEAEQEKREKSERALMEKAAKIPVDRTARTLADGSPVMPDHTELKENGQQKDYVVLSAEERAKGFVRPVRRSYVHVGLNPTMNGSVLVRHGQGGCGARTTMSLSIAETYARDPEFYSGTFCVGCAKHLPLDQFVWEGTAEQVGS